MKERLECFNDRMTIMFAFVLDFRKGQIHTQLDNSGLLQNDRHRPIEQDVRAFYTVFHWVIENAVVELLLEGREPFDCEVFIPVNTIPRIPAEAVEEAVGPSDDSGKGRIGQRWLCTAARNRLRVPSGAARSFITHTSVQASVRVEQKASPHTLMPNCYAGSLAVPKVSRTRSNSLRFCKTTWRRQGGNESLGKSSP